MSIFDMFKKIFSSGSDDSFAETKSLEEISKEQATDETNIEKELEEKEQNEFRSKFNWIEFYNKLLTEDTEVKELLEELIEIYKNPIDTQDLLNTINIVTDTIIEKIPVGALDEYGDISLLKSEIASALVKTVKSSKDGKYDVKSFINSINPDLNNLYTFSTFLVNFVQIYRQNASAMVAFIEELLVDPEVFLKDAFDISKLYNYFLSTPYSEIEEEKKSEFIDKINAFLKKYSDNNFLQRLNYCVKDAKQQAKTQGKGNPSVIGYKG